MLCFRTQLLLKAIVAGLFLFGLAVAPAQEPVAGPNVNMVSGITWPGGDPFLQRQNEPTLAMSSRNPLHLLGGANDYRTVDLPGLPADQKVVGDAWLGLFKSVDGGQTWRSTLLPGYPQDTSAAGLASPLKGLQAGADPTMRAGTNGMFYYSGIAFNRGSNGQGKIFVARYIDDNSKRSNDPFRYIGTAVVDTGNSGQFVDKPWTAVDVPRAGAGTCSIPSGPQGIPAQSFPAGHVYMAYATAVGNEQAAKLMFSRSTNCGATWSPPTKLSEGELASQGSALAIDANTGTLYVFWRTFPLAAKQATIQFVKSTDFGRTFSKPVDVATMNAFEQGTSSISFRTTGFPTVAVDASGKIYVAWSQRGWVQAVDSRIVMTTSSNGGTTWTPPAPVDGSTDRGHQIMPVLSFSRGKLLLIYYDLREDHTSGELKCLPPLCSPGLPYTTAMLTEVRNAEGDRLLPGGPNFVFNDFVADATPTAFTLPTALKRRHTIDVRAAQLNPATGQWTFTRVSQYLYGSRTGNPQIAEPIKQLRFNVPNLPMFGLGTKAFMGDYLDIGASAFFYDAASGWKFDHRTDDTPVAHAVWTDNRDVRPPSDGDWTNYTPPKLAGTSLFDSTKTTLPCTDDSKAGMRNQNIYTSRITQGLVAGALTNTKALSALQRAFSVFVQNGTSQVKFYRLTIVAPPGVVASFIPQAQAPLPFPLLTIEASVPPRSSASRTVFVTSASVTARVTVNVAEIGALGGIPAGEKTSVILNPDLTNPDLTNPDLTNPDLTNPDLTNPDLTNPDLTNPDLTNPDLTNPDLTNPDLTNPDLTNPDLTNIGIPNPDLTNPDLTNPDLTNPDLTNAVIANGNIIDAQWRVTNKGNTPTSYSVKTLFRNRQLPPGIKVQLLLTRTYATPVVRNCQVKLELQNVLVTNIPNPVITDPAGATLINPDLTNPDLTNATISLAPGDTGKITLRVIDLDKTTGVQLCGSPTQPCDPNNPNQLNVGEAFQPVPVAQANNTNAPAIPSIPLIITSLSIPAPTGGVPYNFQLAAVGGAGTRTWSLAPGSSLPAGMTLSPGGLLAGTPTATGPFNFTVQVVDTSAPPQTDTQTLTGSVAVPAISFIAQPVNAIEDVAMAPAIIVRVEDAVGAPLPGVKVALTLKDNPWLGTMSNPTPEPGDLLLAMTIFATTNPAGQAIFTPIINRGGTGYLVSANIPAMPLVTAVSSIPFGVQGVSLSPPMATARHSHTALMLPTGKVLIWGGTAEVASPFSATASQPTPKIELYDPATNTTTAMPAGADSGGARINHTAVLLPQGVVLLTGGRRSDGVVSAEQQYVFFGGAIVQTSIAPSLLPGFEREHHTATVLGNGRNVLLAGGRNTAGVLGTALVHDPQAGTFTIAAMAVPRRNHTATLLADGRVLLTGGYNLAGTPLTSAELFDPQAGTFTPIAAPMNQARAMHAALRLSDGTVLVTGGDATGAPAGTATAERFNPLTQTFTPLPAMPNPRLGHNITQLANGKVLISGGGHPSGYSPSLDLFDPAVSSFTTAPNAIIGGRMGAAATPLWNGQVLLSGGTNGAGVGGTNELFHPIDPPAVPAAFNAGPNLPPARSQFTMTQLPNGKVLIAGGETAPGVSTNSALLYDPATGTIAATAGPMVHARSQHASVLLATGKVLISGGFESGVLQLTAELYDPVTSTFTPTGTMTIARARHGATLLLNGSVLITGGQTAGGAFTASAETFDPSSGGGFIASAASMTTPRASHTATALGAGGVLIAGGENAGGAIGSTELYNLNLPLGPPSFTAGAPMTARTEHTATVLPNANVLVVGGRNGGGSLGSAQVYDLNLGTWSSAGVLPSGTTANLHTATRLGSGKVLIVTGGAAFVFDHVAGTFDTAATPVAPSRQGHSAVLLPNGKVLIGGGTAAGAPLVTTEVFTPGP